MNVQRLSIIAMACLLGACSGNGQVDGSTAKTDSLTVQATGSKRWVDENTLNALPEDARKNILSGNPEPIPAAGPEFVALVGNLNSDDARTRTDAARAISLTMTGAKGDYYNAIQSNVPRYLNEHPLEFLDLFNGTRNMGKTELMAWAQVLKGEGKELSPASSELIRNMKAACSNGDAGQVEVLNLFVSYVTGEGGKKGGLK
ncbi:MAG: hypothetical protein IPJ76_03375 [Flavobacteriales bacterium]|nr:MAG: hypothetical protein IPJ76_03375 [Flavobacteriales bacterium]